MKKIAFIGLILCFAIACKQQQQPDISFYYWKTIFKLSPFEENCLNNNHVKRIYIRYFDIDLSSTSQKPFPRSPIFFDHTPKGMEIIPVVYIKNEVMLDKNLNIDTLAQQTNQLINRINQQHHIKSNEIQIDCDWTLKSRDNYMRFIDTLSKISRKRLSATIRLHQIKYYRKTKIPKVDRAVLMFYNMGKISIDSVNSIYDSQISDRYIKSLKNYPLPLDYALPLFSWGIHIRDNTVIGLINKKDCPDIKKNTSFVLINDNKYRCKNALFLNGNYYKEKDQIKFESISNTDLLQMAQTLRKNSSQAPKEIIFYDLDELNLANYEKGIFKEITDYF